MNNLNQNVKYNQLNKNKKLTHDTKCAVEAREGYISRVYGKSRSQYAHCLRRLNFLGKALISKSHHFHQISSCCEIPNASDKWQKDLSQEACDELIILFVI